MRRRRRRLRALLWVTLVVVGSAAPAQAQRGANTAAHGKEQAKKLFDEGVELEKKADYPGALAKYREAERLTATPGLRFHEAYCLEMTGKLASALEAYGAADQLALEQNKQDVHTAILVRLDPLRARVPQIAIRIATPAQGAEVELDGVTVAPALLEGKAFRVDPGEHIVTAHATGYLDHIRKVRTPESITTTVDVSLERVGTPPPAPAVASGAVAPARAPGEPPPSGVTEPPREGPRSPSRALPIVTTVGTIVLAGAGVASFLVAGGAQSDAERDCLTKTTCDDERSRVRLFDAVALGAFAGAAALAVVSVALWSSKPAGQTGASSPPGRAPGVQLLATPSALGLRGSF
jgi:hypothetical protein